MARIFISYKRADKDKVFPIVEEIKRRTGIDCWIDLEGIESGDQFQKVIIKAIKKADVVICMLSKNFIAPYTDEKTGEIDLERQTFPEKEVMFAINHKKRLIPVSIDGTKVVDCEWLDFNCSGLDCIDWYNKEQQQKFIKNIKQWGESNESESLHKAEKEKDVKTQDWTVRNSTTHISVEKKPSTPKATTKKDFIDYKKLKQFLSQYNKIIYSVIGILFILCVGVYLFNNASSNSTKNTQLVSKPTTSENATETKLESASTVSMDTIPSEFVYVGDSLLKNYNTWDAITGVSKTQTYQVDPFYICKYEVTQSEYESVMHSNPSKIVGSKLPVNTIGLVLACEYCNKKSEIDGYKGFYEINGKTITINHAGNGYRLPTAYEWVLASRPDGATKTKYAGGNNLKDIAWYGANSKGTLHNIGLKQPNARGIYDLNGNVAEWLWEKPWSDCNKELGSDYETYISFSENDIVGPDVIDEANGFRVVLITKSMKNNNTKDVNSIKEVTKPYGSNAY